MADLAPELQEFCEGHKRYGAKLADEAFLKGPVVEYSLDAIRLAVAQTIEETLKPKGYSPQLISLCADYAAIGFGERYFELVVHNHALDQATHAPVRH